MMLIEKSNNIGFSTIVENRNLVIFDWKSNDSRIVTLQFSLYQPAASTYPFDMYADMQWGCGGTSNRAAVDLRHGTKCVLNAASCHVKLISPPLGAAGSDWYVTCDLLEGQCDHVYPTYTHKGGAIGAGGTSATFTVPDYASHVVGVSTPFPGVGDVIKLAPDLAFTVAAQMPANNNQPLPAWARYIAWTSAVGVAAHSFVFTIAL